MATRSFKKIYRLAMADHAVLTTLMRTIVTINCSESGIVLLLSGVRPSCRWSRFALSFGKGAYL